MAIWCPVPIGADSVTHDSPCEHCSLAEFVEKLRGPDVYHASREYKPCDLFTDGYFDLLDFQVLQNTWLTENSHDAD